MYSRHELFCARAKPRLKRATVKPLGRKAGSTQD